MYLEFVVQDPDDLELVILTIASDSESITMRRDV